MWWSYRVTIYKDECQRRFDFVAEGGGKGLPLPTHRSCLICERNSLESQLTPAYDLRRQWISPVAYRLSSRTSIPRASHAAAHS